MPFTPTSLFALAGALVLAPACSSSSNEDSTGPASTPSCTVTPSLDAGFMSLSQVCSSASDPTSLVQDDCGPYVIVTRGTTMANPWYFDATGALVAVITGNTCVTTSATFASQWGVQAWGCATASPLCTADAGSSDAPRD
jgi:hypothetical protein